MNNQSYNPPAILYLFFTLTLFSALIIANTSHAQAVKRLDRAEVEAWADAYYGQAVAEKRNGAITVSVVQDGKVLFQKAYGYQDYSNNIPADAATSGFSVGSITKTFVATAIAQLVDRGMIDSLDDPANKYLTRIQLPGKRGAKITLSHLLNHRAGFANVSYGFLTTTDRINNIKIPLTSEEIMRFMPIIAMEPGGRANYSNWSFSLLGFIVEDITGERLDNYLKKNIFDPLGMSHTSLMYGSHPENWSRQHLFTKSGAAVAAPRSIAHPWIGPAGTMVSTAADIARYMNAHIYQGRDGGYPLLSEKMFQLLHQESYRNGPPLMSIGFAHTFWTEKIDGKNTIEHGGGTPGFQSMMLMIPEYRIGFFASAMQSGLVPWEEYSEEELASNNVAVKEPMTGFELRKSFVERFFPQQITYPSGPKSDLKKLVGDYYTAMRTFTTVEDLVDGFNPAAVFTVSLGKNAGEILLGGRGPYREIGNGIFKNMSDESQWTSPYTLDLFSPSYIAFNLSEDGTVIDMIPGLSDQVWLPVSSIFNPKTMLQWFIIFGVVALSGLFIFLWPVKQRFTNTANWLSALLAMAVITIPCTMMFGFSQWDSLIAQMGIGDSTRLWVIVIASNSIMVLGLLLIWQCVTEFGQHSADIQRWAIKARKVHLILLTLVALLLVTALIQFNLIGFNIPG